MGIWLLVSETEGGADRHSHGAARGVEFFPCNYIFLRHYYDDCPLAPFSFRSCIVIVTTLCDRSSFIFIIKLFYVFHGVYCKSLKMFFTTKVGVYQGISLVEVLGGRPVLQLKYTHTSCAEQSSICNKFAFSDRTQPFDVKAMLLTSTRSFPSCFHSVHLQKRVRIHIWC